MFMSLTRKIDYEYNNFYNMMITMSKQNIYARSDEISCKKLIKRTLSKENLFPMEEEQRLMLRFNLLDEIYSMMEPEERTGAGTVMECVEKILEYTPA